MAHDIRARGLLQRRCSCGNHTVGGGSCAECERTGRHIQRLAETAPAQTPAVPASVGEALASAGSPLGGDVRLDMEQRFGHDFSGVRVHAGASAQRSARDLSAHAYTVGRDVVFGAGQYAPNTVVGRHLLAHELAHVVQQGASASADSDLVVDAPDSAFEANADHAVAHVMAGRPVQRAMAGSAPSNLVLRHSADKTICPAPPKWQRISAAPKDVYGPANEAIEQAYLDASRHKNHAVLLGSQFEYGGNKEIRLPKGTADRKANDAILSRLRGLVKQRAPDIMNFTERVFYEIKTPEYAVGGMAQLGSYYALTDVIRQELGEEGGPPWDQGAATWYPPHVLPFPRNLRRVVCTQMTDYSVTTPGLILYIVLERKEEDDDDKKKQEQVEQVAKPEENKDKKEQSQQKAPEGTGDDSVVPIVAVGAGGAVLTAGTIAYLKKRAADQAKRRAAQEAMRKWAERAAKKKAAEAAGKGVAGKAAAKAAAYGEIAAAAALIIFYSDRVEAGVGPGPSAMESLYKAMTTNGTPPSPEMKKLIESDPVLKQLVEDAAGGGDGSPIQEEMTRRVLELIRDNPDQFSPEDLQLLMEYSKNVKDAGQSPQTVEELQKAIEAAKAGRPMGGKKGDGGAEAGKTEEAKKTEDKPQEPPAEKAVELSQAARDQVAKAPPPVRDLFKGLMGVKGAKMTDAHVERFLRMMPADLTAEQVKKLVEKATTKEGATADEILDALQAAIAELQKGQSPKKDPGAPPQTGKDPADTPGPADAPAHTPPSRPDATQTTGPTVTGSKKTTPEQVIKQLAARAKKTKFGDLKAGEYRITWKLDPEDKPKRKGAYEPAVGDFISGSLRGRRADKTGYVGRVEAEVTAVDGVKLKIKFVTATPMVTAAGEVVFTADHFLDGKERDVQLDRSKKAGTRKRR